MVEMEVDTNETIHGIATITTGTAINITGGNVVGFVKNTKDEVSMF